MGKVESHLNQTFMSESLPLFHPVIMKTVRENTAMNSQQFGWNRWLLNDLHITES